MKMSQIEAKKAQAMTDTVDRLAAVEQSLFDLHQKVDQVLELLKPVEEVQPKAEGKKPKAEKETKTE